MKFGTFLGWLNRCYLLHQLQPLMVFPQHSNVDTLFYSNRKKAANKIVSSGKRSGMSYFAWCVERFEQVVRYI